MCKAGTYEPPGNRGGDCLPCPLGTWAAVGAVGACTPCEGKNVTTDQTGSTSKDNCSKLKLKLKSELIYEKLYINSNRKKTRVESSQTETEFVVFVSRHLNLIRII